MKNTNADWWKSLEQERHDMSYLKAPKEVAVTQFTKIVYRDKPVDFQYRDNIMFHAGRASMGATDATALNAAKVAKRMIGKAGKK